MYRALLSASMVIKGTTQSLQHYWSLTIRLFSVISRRLVGESYPLPRNSLCILQPKLTRPFVAGWFLHLCREAVGVFFCPYWLGHALEESYSSAEKSVYSTAPADWGIDINKNFFSNILIYSYISFRVNANSSECCFQISDGVNGVLVTLSSQTVPTDSSWLGSWRNFKWNKINNLKRWKFTQIIYA